MVECQVMQIEMTERGGIRDNGKQWQISSAMNSKLEKEGIQKDSWTEGFRGPENLEEVVA